MNKKFDFAMFYVFFYTYGVLSWLGTVFQRLANEALVSSIPDEIRKLNTNPTLEENFKGLNDLPFKMQLASLELARGVMCMCISLPEEDDPPSIDWICDSCGETFSEPQEEGATELLCECGKGYLHPKGEVPCPK